MPRHNAKREEAARAVSRYNRMPSAMRKGLNPGILKSMGIRKRYDDTFELDPTFFMNDWQEDDNSGWSSWSSTNSDSDWSSSSSTYNSNDNDNGSSSNDNSSSYDSDNY